MKRNINYDLLFCLFMAIIFGATLVLTAALVGCGPAHTAVPAAY